MAGSAQGHEVVPAGCLEPPLGQAEVDEHIVREESGGGAVRLQELHEELGEFLGPAGVEGAHDSASARLRPTVRMVRSSSVVGLNSTTSVPAKRRGRWPGAP